MSWKVIAAAVVLAACTTTDPASPDGTSQVSVPDITSAPGETPDPEAAPGDDGALVCWEAEPRPGPAEFAFSDATVEAGLLDPLTGMHGHAAAWGDVNGDLIADLVVGTFANRPIEQYQVRGADGPRADTLLVGSADGLFSAVADFPEALGRTSGAIIADLDGDGDNDVMLSRNMRERERAAEPTQIYRNDGDTFALVDVDLGRLVSGRSIGVIDYNRDSLLDIVLLEDRWAGNRSTVLLENRGSLQFHEVTDEVGLPEGITGLGIATSDVNGDGRTDFFVGGSNRLFIATDDGFVEGDSEVFSWPVFGDEDDAAGAAIADVNRDGLPDLVVGHHYNSTLSQQRQVPIRLYLNEGTDDGGIPRFRDVTVEAGLVGLPTKAPHVEVADIDNDLWPDIVTTASAADGNQPAIFRNLGTEPGGTPTFEAPAGLGSPQYWVAGPTADVDRDGRVDILLVEWEPSLPSLFLRNETGSGNWLEVTVSGPQPIGTVVWVWEGGGLDQPEALLGMREIVVSQGYTSGGLPVAHFGLGTVATVDVRIVSPDGTSFAVTEVAANRHIRIPGGC